MNLGQLLTVDHVVPEMKGSDHKLAIAELVDHLEDNHLLRNVGKEEVLELLYQREEQTSTGIGSGVAIPHTFVDDLDEVVTVFGRSREGIDFGALDNAPVHFVIMFIVPKAEYHMHLKTLAAIAKMFNNTEIRRQLTDAEGSQDILEILSQRMARS